MLFGDTSDFAIEAIVEPNLEPPSAVWGRMRVWCQGIAFGDFDEPCCALYPAYLGFRPLYGFVGELWTPEFAEMNDQDILNALDGHFYGHHGSLRLVNEPSLPDRLQPETGLGRHVFLTSWGEQFNRTAKAFILRRPDRTVVILTLGLPAGRGLRLWTTEDALKSVIHQFVDWFHAETDRLSG